MAKEKKQWNLKPGGIKVAAEMLAGLDELTRKRILSNILAQDPQLAQKIEQEIYVFDDLLTLTSQDLQKLLSEVSEKRLALAMRAVSDPVRDAVFRNLPKARAQSLHEEMETQGKQKRSDVELAQREILKLALKLGEEGKIQFSK